MSFQPLNNYPNNKLYQYEIKPVLLNCSFQVAAADSGGLGLINLTGPGIANVFMHTSQSAGTGNHGVVNPNPPAGNIMVQLESCYQSVLQVMSSIQSPNTGSALTSVTQHDVYVITGLGTATLAQWQAKGLPVGVTPALGQAFVATASGTIGGSAAVQLASVSGISSIELVGNPSAINKNSNVYLNGGMQIQLQCLAPTVSAGAYVSPMIPTAPADGSVIRLSLLLSNSSVTIQGQ